jgi:hypothetical protein
MGAGNRVLGKVWQAKLVRDTAVVGSARHSRQSTSWRRDSRHCDASPSMAKPVALRQAMLGWSRQHSSGPSIACQGRAEQAEHRWARRSGSWPCESEQAELGLSHPVMARPGSVGQCRRCLARQGAAGPVIARQARHGGARSSALSLVLAGGASLGVACPGQARLGKAGLAWRGADDHGAVWRHMAGRPGRGASRLCWARQCRLNMAGRVCARYGCTLQGRQGLACLSLSSRSQSVQAWKCLAGRVPLGRGSVRQARRGGAKHAVAHPCPAKPVLQKPEAGILCPGLIFMPSNASLRSQFHPRLCPERRS